ncbi:MAG: hypothetical protein ACR2G7_08905 [Acidimicrobiales bacterium]
MDTKCQDQGVFAQSRERFEEMLTFLGGDEAALLTHAEMEDHIASHGRELLRQLYDDHLALRALREARLEEVADAQGVSRPNVEAGHSRVLTTIFGELSVSRLAYRQRGQANLHPADAALNLPDERHSHGLRRLAAVESSKGSFDEATGVIRATSGVNVGKRQVEELVRRAAVDFEGFYGSSPRPAAEPGDVVVISADGKGVVMRPDALRPHTAAAAKRACPKLGARLSKGEKRNRKRMAEVGAVYDTTPSPRSPEEIFSADVEAPSAPRAKGKWLTASLVEDAATVVAALFEEAERRDPDHGRTWVALVDGNNHQISPAELSVGFHTAMGIAAGLALFGAGQAWLTIGSERPRRPEPSVEALAQHHCAVGAPPLR